jgi:hypothetical protein
MSFQIIIVFWQHFGIKFSKQMWNLNKKVIKKKKEKL